MAKLSKWTWLACGLILAVAGCLAMLLFIFLAPMSNSRDNQNPTKQAEMVEIISKWGRLAPFPENAENLLIRTEGNTFTRSFRASFNAPEQEIRAWIAASPGLTEAAITSTSDGKLKYLISPGSGANYAEAVIDFKSGKVEVYVSWS